DMVTASGLAGMQIILNTTPPHHQYHIDRATAIQPMLEKIGFKVQLDPLQYAAFKDVESKKQVQMTAATYAGYGDPNTPLVNSFTTAGERNYGNFTVPAYDAMAQKQLGEDDPKARLQIIQDMQRYLLKGTPMAHAQWFSNTTIAVRKRVHNFLGTNIANSSTA